MITIGNRHVMKHFTLHVRLTKKCNADCSYCSSWQAEPITYMSVSDFKKSIDFIVDNLLPLYGYNRSNSHTITLQYIGGEIAIIPKGILYQYVFYARTRFQEVFSNIIDGVQSNLVTSERRVKAMSNLFGKNIGTSVDSLGSARTISKSPDKYREILERNIDFLRVNRNTNPGRIFVVDAEGIQNTEFEMERANNEGYDLTLRPVFLGGRDIGACTPDEIQNEFSRLFDIWFMKYNISVNPFYHLVNGILYEKTGLKDFTFKVGCPFQKDCAEVSLDLEPDGSLFVCLDMADSNQLPLGNAITSEFNIDLWNMIKHRKEHYDLNCKSCTWLSTCQGGCMSEALHSSKSMYGKTELCSSWKTIFSKIEIGIENYGLQNVINWFSKI